MTTFSVRIAAVFSALALAASVAAFAAQEPKSTDLLTAKQVQDLIATADTSADHARLQKHFLALAAKYDTEAAEHAGLAQSYRKPHVGRLMPGRRTKQAEHCDRMTQTLRDAAKGARELASEHGQVATAK